MLDDYQAARMLRVLSRVVDARSRRRGMRPLQVDVLQYLATAPRAERTARNVACAHGLSTGQVSWVITELIETGYVRLVCDEADPERLALTSAGHEMAELDPVLVMAATIGTLPEAQRQSFHESVEWVFRHYLERVEKPER